MLIDGAAPFPTSASLRGCLPVASWKVAPPRAEVLEAARLYAELRWRGDARNMLHGCDPDGVRVDTPDRTFVPDGWDDDNVGVPYAWGGFDTPASFLQAIEDGFIAGFVFTDSRENHPSASRYAAGLDCSGFISRCWGLPGHLSTTRLGAVCVPLNGFDDLLPADILNRAGDHVFLFKEFTDASRTRVRVYEAGAWRVKESEYDVAVLAAQGFKPLTDWRRSAVSR